MTSAPQPAAPATASPDPVLLAEHPDPSRPLALQPLSAAPPWMHPLIERTLEGPHPDWVTEAMQRRADTELPGRPSRSAAVLILLAETADGPDLLLTQRAATLRSHAGQPAFPGGGLDAGETVVQAALREGQEETGLDPSAVTPLLLLPRLFLPVSSYAVTPVVAFWQRPGPVGPVDPAETAAVARVPIADLVDPVNRVMLRHPSGFVGPAFNVGNMQVWGFTAALVDLLLELAGWALPWDTTRVQDMAAESTEVDLSTDELIEPHPTDGPRGRRRPGATR